MNYDDEERFQVILSATIDGKQIETVDVSLETIERCSIKTANITNENSNLSAGI